MGSSGSRWSGWGPSLRDLEELEMFKPQTFRYSTAEHVSQLAC